MIPFSIFLNFFSKQDMKTYLFLFSVFKKIKKLTRSFEKKGFKIFSKLVFALLAHVFEVRSGSRVGK